jgi:hypothetical protein
MGHATFSQTFRNYLHLNPYILAQKNQNFQARISCEELGKLLFPGIEGPSADKLLGQIRGEFGFLFKEETGKLRTTPQTLNVEKRGKRIPFSTAIQFLERLEKGDSFAATRERFELSSEAAAKYLRAAVYVFCLQNQRGQTGVFSGPSGPCGSSLTPRNLFSRLTNFLTIRFFGRFLIKPSELFGRN